MRHLRQSIEALSPLPTDRLRTGPSLRSKHWSPGRTETHSVKALALTLDTRRALNTRRALIKDMTSIDYMDFRLSHRPENRPSSWYLSFSGSATSAYSSALNSLTVSRLLGSLASKLPGPYRNVFCQRFRLHPTDLLLPSQLIMG